MRSLAMATVLAAALVTGACDKGVDKVTPEPKAELAFAVPGRGAQVPFVEYEAESAVHTGQLIGPGRDAHTLAGEASGRMAVTLKPGQRIEFTLVQPANAITARYSIADNTTGTMRVQGVDIPLTSTYSWFYGGYPFTNSPADGLAHHFYDDVRARLGTTLATGTKVTLECACTVDLADFELVPEPLAQPPGSVSIVDFGADPTGVKDSSDAFDKAGRDVWIPPGTFKVTRHIMVDRVTIRGAGSWDSVLTGAGVGIYGQGTNIHLSDFAIIGEVTERVDAAQLNALGGKMGGGSTVERLFLQHTKVGIWLDGPFDGLAVRGTQIMDMTADGLNLHQGISHAVVENNLIRNTGDDGLAMWSDQQPNHHNIFRNNTVQLPMLANGIGVYGGHDNEVTGNVVADTVIEGAGIQLANRFSGTVPLDGVTTLRDNTLLRTGSRFAGVADVGAIFLYGKDSPIMGVIELRGNHAIDSSFAGLHLLASKVTDLRVDRLVVTRPGTVGLQIQAGGAATVANSRVEGGVYLCAEALPFALQVTSSEGLDTPACKGI